jgi:hypothetical protein
VPEMIDCAAQKFSFGNTVPKICRCRKAVVLENDSFPLYQIKNILQWNKCLSTLLLGFGTVKYVGTIFISKKLLQTQLEALAY